MSAQAANLGIDTISRLVRIRHIIIDLHGGRADPLDDRQVLLGAEPRFDPQRYACILSLRRNLLEPFNHNVRALGVVSQIAVAEERQQDYVRAHHFGDVYRLRDPSLGPRVALVGHAVESAHRKRGYLHLVPLCLGEDFLLQVLIKERQVVLPAAEIHLDAVQANLLGQLERFRIRRLAYRPVADRQLEAFVRPGPALRRFARRGQRKPGQYACPGL